MLKDVMLSGFLSLAREDMRKIVENRLNPERYHLSAEAKKRLNWLYVLEYECNNNTAQAARKIGISRPWLSTLKNKWLFSRRDPRVLEPESRAPRNTKNRKKIPLKTQETILAVRGKHKWGKDKIAWVLKRDYGIIVGATTVNRYLKTNNLIDIRLSQKNQRAWQNKKKNTYTRKYRPPSVIKDYVPGALVEKDMKFIQRSVQFVNSDKYRAKENFDYQHTVTDSFTRIRTLELCRESDSKTAVARQAQAMKRMPFGVACANTDNGGENGGAFSDYLERNGVQHFYSRSGTPTDNPRVERSHLTDDVEFWNRTEKGLSFSEKKSALKKWEHTYNYVRPHQALGMLTPMEFYQLWKTKPEEAYAIKDKYQKYLKKNARRLATSRKLKNKEEIEALMRQIDEKLKKSYQ